MEPKYTQEFLTRLADHYTSRYPILNRETHSKLVTFAFSGPGPRRNLIEYNKWMRETMRAMKPSHIQWANLFPSDFAYQEFVRVPRGECIPIADMGWEERSGLAGLMRETQNPGLVSANDKSFSTQ